MGVFGIFRGIGRLARGKVKKGLADIGRGAIDLAPVAATLLTAGAAAPAAAGAAGLTGKAALQAAKGIAPRALPQIGRAASGGLLSQIGRGVGILKPGGGIDLGNLAKGVLMGGAGVFGATQALGASRGVGRALDAQSRLANMQADEASRLLTEARPMRAALSRAVGDRMTAGPRPMPDLSHTRDTANPYARRRLTPPASPSY
jgi:hypothetical protein